MSTDADKAKEKEMAEAFEETSKAALLVRDALIGALPVAPEQYLTLSVPGTLVDTNDIEQGGVLRLQCGHESLRAYRRQASRGKAGGRHDAAGHHHGMSPSLPGMQAHQH